MRAQVEKRKRKTLRESFGTRMAILAYMIEQGRPVTPKEINEATGIDHYPTVNYHLSALVREGVVIPIRSNSPAVLDTYQLQPFMVKREIDPNLREVVNSAFNETYAEHFITNNGSEESSLKIKIEAFNNAFLYYLKYLLETGRFQE